MALSAGDKLGSYEIVSLLGSGGMGEVYRARDPRLGREVAIKVLPAAFAADADRLRRLEREARAAAALNHPNIITVYSVEQFDAHLFLTMELVEGRSLALVIPKGGLRLDDLLTIAIPLTDAIAAAHAKGITHRDLKPANIMIGAGDHAGRVKVLDFGLAKQDESSLPSASAPTITTEGRVLGTVAYMSPEQAAGARADTRSDLFSLGVILYQMATGQRPFQGDTNVTVLLSILKDTPPPVTNINSTLPSELGRIIKHCLVKDPARRYQTAADLRNELAELKQDLDSGVLAGGEKDLGLALESIAAGSGSGPVTAATAIDPTPRFTVRRVAAWLAIVLVAAAAGAVAHQRFAPRLLFDPPLLESLTYSGHDRSPAASPDGKTIAFMSNRDGVPRIWLKQVAGGGELALTEGPDDFPRFSPDGSTILFVRTTPESSSLYRVSLLGGDPRKLLDDVAGADWSSDGRQLAFTRWLSGERSGSVVGLSDAAGSGAREIAFVAGRALVTPRWSPDGRTIAAVNGLGNVAAGFGIDLVDVFGSGTHRLESARPNMRQSSVVWSADSRSVIYSEAESIAAWLSGSSARIIRQDVTTGSARAILWVANHSQTLDVLAPGRLLFDTRSSRENLRELPLGDSQNSPRWLTRGNSTDRQPAYSPDGQWVAFSSNRGGDLDLWAVNRTNGTVRRLTDDAADDWDVSYSPDGRRLLWGSNRTGPYEIWSSNPDGSGPRQLSHDGAFAQNPQATSDGKWIVYHSTNPAHPGLWRIRADGTDPVRIVDGALQLPEISPDGQNVLYVDGLTARIRVVRLQDGVAVPFDIAIDCRANTTAVLGRARWMPNGRAIAFIGQDERGINGVFVQDFVPGRDTIASRRKLGGFDPENSAETLAISPDGRTLTIGGWEQLFNIMVASHVPGIERTTRP